MSTTATPFLQCPILAVTAQGSTVAALSDMAGWAKLTTGAFTSEEVNVYMSVCMCGVLSFPGPDNVSSHNPQHQPQLTADGGGPSGGGGNHYAHMRSGATDGLVRALTRTTLGRAILMKVDERAMHK